MTPRRVADPCRITEAQALLCSSLGYFRGRLGVDGFRKVFRQVIAGTREQGLVKDRLRLKDARHVIANIAVPTTLALIAQIRDALLAAAEAFGRLRVEGEPVNIAGLRAATADQSNEQRRVARVTHLREILMWGDELAPPPAADEPPAWQALVQKRRLAHKILADQEHPQAGERTLSIVDSEARCGTHGPWYDGFVIDISVDAEFGTDLLPQQEANSRDFTSGMNKPSPPRFTPHHGGPIPAILRRQFDC